MRKKILIVGAGPTGLVLAHTLSQWSIPFDIVDLKADVSNTSKGLSMNVLSQMTFAMLGLAGRVGVSAHRLKSLCLMNEKRQLMRYRFKYLGGDQGVITQPQAVTEKELQAALEDRGVSVKWNTRVTAIQERADGRYQVALQELELSGQEKIYDFVVGCDGKNSVVRKHMNVEMDGANYPIYFILGDFEFTQDVSPGEVKYISTQDHFLILVPLGQRNYRVVSLLPQLESDESKVASLLSNRVNDYFEKQIITEKATWISSAQVYLRIAERLRERGLFLCGDSAHLVSPIGGTGMNMGIQDAFNLGCKLGAVVEGQRPATYLNDYESERLPVVRETCRAADASTEMIFNPEVREKRMAMLLPTMANRTAMRRIFPKVYAGLTIRYSMPQAETLAPQFAACVGKPFVPFLKLYSSGVIQGLQTSVFCLVNPAQPTMVDSARTAMSNFLESLENAKGIPFRCYSNLLEERGIRRLSLPDLDPTFPLNVIYLINAEGFIEYVSTFDDVDHLLNFLQSQYSGISYAEGVH